MPHHLPLNSTATRFVTRAARARGRLPSSSISGGERLRLKPIASAVTAFLIAGGMIGSAHAVQPFSAAWFANKGAIQATVAATGLMPNGTPVSSLSPQAQQQQANTQLQQSIANLGQAARGIAWLQGMQASQRQTALGNPSNIPDGLGAGGLDTGSLAASWTNASAPTQSTDANGKTVVDIQQTADKAIANWQTFNVGKNTIVQFDQASSDWAILNRITDPAMAPSTIEGQIRAPGTVLIVNQNGIVFSGSSQVNTRNLVAAAANITDLQFQTNGIFGPDQTTPSFTNASGNLIVQAGAQITTNAPNSVTQAGGYVLLMGQQVSNAGDIETPQGQAELAAGDNFIIRKGVGTDANQWSTTRGNEISPQLNGGSLAGQVINTGLLLATEGDITLAGHDVEQNGVAVATTTVNTRGTIHLLNSAADTTGQIVLGPDAVTAILLQDDGQTALDSQRDALIANSATQDAARQQAAAGGAMFDNLSVLPDREDQSRIEIVSGGNIDFQGGSMTLATGGQIAASTGNAAISGANPGGRIQLESGAQADVSGAVGVQLSMASNNLQINIQGNEQRDAPDNRDSGALNNGSVWVDINDLILVPAGTGGYPTDRYYTPGGLLEVSGYLANTGHSIGEWAALGGTVTLAGNEVVTQPGSTVNISGGSLDVQTGYINQSWLVGSDGQLYSADNAPAGMTFTGIYKGFEVAHARWGADAAEFFYNPLIAPQKRLENGYTAGRDAGTLILSTPTAIIEGGVLATAFNGSGQQTAQPAGVGDGYKLSQNTVAQAGSLLLGEYGAAGLFDAFDTDVQFGSFTPIASSLAIGDAMPADRIDTAWFDTGLIDGYGLGGLAVATRASIAIDAPLVFAPDATVKLTAPSVNIAANVTDRSGNVAISNILQPAGVSGTALTDMNGLEQATLAGGATIDTHGLWINTQMDSADLPGLAFIDGGSVSFDETQGITLSGGSVIDTSSGGAIVTGGKTRGGKGGDINLIADDPSVGGVADSGDLILDGSLHAYGVTKGGALTLAAPSVLIADNAGAAQSGQLMLPSAFFAQGFSDYDITGYNGVAVAPGTQVSVVEPVYQFNSGDNTAPSGSAFSDVFTIWTPPIYSPNPVNDTLTQRAGASLALHGNNILSGGGVGPVTVGAGAILAVDPLQSIGIDSFDQITIDGTLRAPGGAISILGLTSDNSMSGQSIWIGGDAVLDVAGAPFVATDSQGRQYGVAPAGGAIVLGAAGDVMNPNGIIDSSYDFIVVRPGAVLDASGSSAQIGLATGAATVAGDGGSIAMSSYSGIYTDGTLLAAAGGPGAAGGTLAVTLETPGNFANYDPTSPSWVPRVITISQETLAPQLSDALQPGVSDPALQFGQAQLSADALAASGFGTLSLTARDAILFNGDVHLAAAQSIAFHEGALADTSTAAHVTITAPYVLLGGETGTLINFYPTLWGAGAIAWQPSTQQSTGTFTVNADLIDIADAVAFGIDSPATANNLGTPIAYDYAGFGNVNLISQGDIRFTGVSSSLSTAMLVTSGDLTFTAAQLYPTSGAIVPVTAGLTAGPSGQLLSADSVIDVERIDPAAADPALPYSVLGQLTFLAGTINQDGIIRAPLGKITLGTTAYDFDAQNGFTAAVNLLPGSITSTSMDGLTMPYGGTADGVTYSYNGTALTTPLLLLNQIIVSSPSVNVAAGALIDVSGGGELAGSGFISGRGGSIDVLKTPLVNANPANTFSAAGDQVYAIVAGYQSAYAPVDSAAGAAPGIGRQITIPAGVPGLPAGTYTLLPADYALLPGGYRIELGQAGSSLVGQSFQGATPAGNGSYLIDGHQGIANAGVQNALPVQAIVTPGSAVRQDSQYNETTYNDFELQQATTLSQIRPVLTADAGSLLLQMGNTPSATLPPLTFDGTALFQAGAGGQPGQASISVGDVEIYGTAPTPGFTGVSLDVADINRIAAPGLTIGQGGSVTVRGGADLKAAQVVLVSGLGADGDGIILDPGAEIDTIGQGAAPINIATGNIIRASGNAVLAVSNGNVNLVYTPFTAFPSLATIDLGDNTKLYSEGSIGFATGGAVTIADTTLLGTSNLGLSSGAINIGDPAAMAAATVPAGLNLTQARLNLLLAGGTSTGAPPLQTLTLTASQSFNVFGAIDLNILNPKTGRADLDLVLNTPAIYGYGNAGDSASLTVGTLTWSGIGTTDPASSSIIGSAPPGAIVANGPGTGAGIFSIIADKIAFGFPATVAPDNQNTYDRVIYGFSTVNLIAPVITSNNKNTLAVYQAQGANPGDPGIGGNLNLNTSLLTGSAASIMGITAGGALTIAPPSGAAPDTTSSGALGAEIDLAGNTINVAGSILLPSGKLRLTANGDIDIQAGSRIDLAGRPTTLVDQTEYSWGGDVTMSSANGGINQDAGSTIDVSAVDNNAGTLTFQAVGAGAGQGQVALNGVLLGAATLSPGVIGAFNGGSIAVGAQTLNSGSAVNLSSDFAALNSVLDSSGFSDARTFDLKQGDLSIGDGLHAHTISVSVDNGSLTVNGTIDASGAAPGTIRLAAQHDLTLGASAVLDAHGTVLQADSYGNPVDAENAGSVSLTTANGLLTLSGGSTIDVSVTSPQGVVLASVGNVGLNAPRTGSGAASATGAGAPANATGDGVAISAAETVNIKGASSIAVNAFATYANAPADPNDANGQVINQAYLDEINTDSQAFMATAGANPALQTTLAGLIAYGSAFHLRPGIEIASATPNGDLSIQGDLDLSGYRYSDPSGYGLQVNPGIYGSGEPGVLIVRSGDNLGIYGSVTDGFSPPPATPDDNGWVIVDGTTLIQNTTVLTDVTLPAGTTFSTAGNATLAYAIAINATFVAANAVIPIALTVSSDITLPGSWTTTAQILLPGGQVIAKGTILAAGTLIPAGSSLAAGSELPVRYGIAAMTIPANTSLGFLTNVTLSGVATVQPGQVIPAGTTLALAPLPADGSGTLTTPFVVSSPIMVTVQIPNSGTVNFPIPSSQETVNFDTAIPVSFEIFGTNTTIAAFTTSATTTITLSTGVVFPPNTLVPSGTKLRSATVSAGGSIPSGVISNPLLNITTDDDLPAGTDLSIFSQAVNLSAMLNAGAVLPAGTDVFGASFPGAITQNTRPTLPSGVQGRIWAVAPLLPQGDLSWSQQFVSGADLGAADTGTLQPKAVLGQGGNIVLSDSHFGGGSADSLFSFSVIRTGTGSLDLLAGGDFNETTLYGIYTAGTQSAGIGANGADPYNLSRGLFPDGSGAVLGNGNSAYEGSILNYSAYYPTGGGDLQVSVQGNLNGMTVGNNGTGTAPGNWLWSQGGAVAGQAGAWWINFGTYAYQLENGSDLVALAGFTGIGTLGGGNLTLDIGGDAGGLNAAVGSTGRIMADGTLVETGGGKLIANVGGVLNDGAFTDVRGDTAINAGAAGAIAPFYGTAYSQRFSGIGFVDPRAIDPLASDGVSVILGGVTVNPGDGSVTISARGDLVLSDAGNPGLSSQPNTTPFSNAGVNYPGDGNGWFSLWTDATAVNLFSAGGNLVPTEYQGPAEQGSPGNGLFIYPSKLNVVAASGSIYVRPDFNTVAQPAMVELAPAPDGQLNLLAQGSIFGVAIAMSGADPSVAPTPSNPAFYSPEGVTDLSQNTYSQGGNASAFFAYGPDTPTTDLHADDSNPIRIYAATGDIVALDLGAVIDWTKAGLSDSHALITPSTWYIGAKPAQIVAGRDIVLSPTPNIVDGEETYGFVLNESPADVSLISAGRDMFYSGMQVGGPGLLQVTAGRNDYAADQGTLLSIGPVFDVNQGNRSSGADIAVMAGVGASGPDYAAFANSYLNPAGTLNLTGGSQIVQSYDVQLAAWLQQRFGYAGTAADAFAYFESLPALQQSVFVRQVYFDELNQSGLEFNDPASVRFQSYVRGRDAIAALFSGQDAQGNPVVYDGAITLFGNAGIHTDFGGTIQTLTPGGQTLVGVEGANPPGTAGVVTQGSGDIDMYSLGSILLGQSRVMTTFGGDIVAWSATGDINAGRGAKTTQVFTPSRLVYDDLGDITLSPNTPSSGAGFATLDPIPEVAPGDMNLIAPLGTIDAGEAGIRVSGNVNLAALQVVNAANIEVKGKSTGIPAIAAVNVGALTNASAAASQAAMAAQDVVQRDRAAARQVLPSIFTVRVLGFGNDPAGSGAENAPGAPAAPAQSVDVSYRTNSAVQVIGDATAGKDERSALTAAERKALGF
jgi:filamentous hemagglutinin family protein